MMDAGSMLTTAAAAAVVAAVALAGGCVDTRPPAAGPGAVAVWPPPAAGDQAPAVADGIIRRAVCVGVATTADRVACPGADVDARVAASWMRGRPVLVLIDDAATVRAVTSAVVEAAEGMGPRDLLTLTISSHGTTRPDRSGDEQDGRDEGVVLFDGVLWDDDVWALLGALPPCRVEVITDTCHAEGNWRRIARAVGLAKPAPPPRFDLTRGADAGGPGWAGQLVQFAGCQERGYSYGSTLGGEWTMALAMAYPGADSRRAWFDGAVPRVTTGQAPVFATYNASPAFIAGRPLE